MRKRFSPEFVNRLDSVITYRPLDREACDQILDQLLATFGRLVHNRLGFRAFRLQCSAAGRKLLLDHGTSRDYGARELKRTVERHFMQPVAALVSQGEIPPGSTVVLDAKGSEFNIVLRH